MKYISCNRIHIDSCIYSHSVVILGLLESIYSHNHRHTEVLRILDLLLHVAAALLQQVKVLYAGTHKHTFN